MITSPATITYDHETFEALVIRALNVMPDYTYAACVSWRDHSGYTPGAEHQPLGPSQAFAIDTASIAVARAKLDVLYRAAAAYQAAVARNGGVDPYIENNAFGAELEDVGILTTRVDLWSTLEFNAHETLLALLEREMIQPGTYCIRILQSGK